MLDEVQNLMTQMAEGLHGEMHESDIAAKVIAFVIHSHAEYSVHFYEEGGIDKQMESEIDFFDLFERLRVAMYKAAPEKGAWYVVVLSVDRDGKFDFNFDYDDRTQFGIKPDEEEFAEDLAMFPRSAV